MFAAEKDIKLELEDVDLLAGQARTAEFLAKNSSGGVPVLQLDDGSYLPESVAICHYLEGLRPEPSLFGRNLREQVEIEMWNRRMELEVFSTIGGAVVNTHPMFKGFLEQFPDFGEAQRKNALARLERMDRELDGREFVAGNRFSIADITAVIAIDIGNVLGNIQIDPKLRNLSRWHNTVSERPSAKA
jgi:glutathione S-transferase